jgi:transposase
MTTEQNNIIKSEIREGKIHNVEDLISIILKEFKIKYSKSWAYELFRELSLKDGIKYPLPKINEKKSIKKDITESHNSKIFLNKDGLECLKVSKKLYFIRHDDIDALNDLIFSEKNNKLLKRYLFISALNNMVNLEETTKIFNISISTARLWLNLWNESGLEGLIIKWGGGRPNFLTSEQRSIVKDYIMNNHVTRHSEVHKFILDNFGIDYSMSHLYLFIKKN